MQRLHVGIDLFLHVPRKEPKMFSGLDSGPGQDNAVDAAGQIHRDGDGHRQVGLSRAGRPDAEDHVVVEQSANIINLGRCPGLDNLLPGPDLESLAVFFTGMRTSALRACRRIRRRRPGSALESNGGVDILGIDGSPAFKSFVKGAKNPEGRSRRVAVTVDMQEIAAARDQDTSFGFNLRQVPIVFAAQADQQAVVRKLEAATITRRQVPGH